VSRKRTVYYELDPSRPPQLSAATKRRLDAMSDADIDYSDIPEITDFSGFRRVGAEQKRVPIDADIVEWFKGQGIASHEINRVLRTYIRRSRATKGRTPPAPDKHR
jgi:uncharacterized protein (DUF4415 family)